MKPDANWTRNRYHGYLAYGTRDPVEIIRCICQDFLHDLTSKKHSTDTRAGIQYEGSGIELDIDSILRVMLWNHYRDVRQPIKITREVIWDKPWRQLKLTSHFASDFDGHIVTIRGPKLDNSDIPDADFEIINDSAQLPNERKLLPSSSYHRDL